MCAAKRSTFAGLANPAGQRAKQGTRCHFHKPCPSSRGDPARAPRPRFAAVVRHIDEQRVLLQAEFLERCPQSPEVVIDAPEHAIGFGHSFVEPAARKALRALRAPPVASESSWRANRQRSAWCDGADERNRSVSEDVHAIAIVGFSRPLCRSLGSIYEVDPENWTGGIVKNRPQKKNDPYVQKTTSAQSELKAQVGLEALKVSSQCIR